MRCAGIAKRNKSNEDVGTEYNTEQADFLKYDTFSK